MDRVRRALEIAGQVAFLLVCLTLTAYIWSKWSSTGTAAASGAQEETPFSAGSAMNPLPDVSFSETQLSAILFVQSACRFCTESMPFYKSLSGLRARSGALQLVAASFEDEATTERYVTSHDVPVDRVLKVSMSNYKVSGTPTLVLVDSRGTVLGSWQGLLNEDQQNELLKLVRSRTAG